MEKKYVASALLIIGLFLIILSYRNLYSLNGTVFDSSTLNPLPIAAHSSNVTNFIVGIRSDLKKVGVYVDNVAGEGWINHPFEMSLRNGMGAELMITEEAPPGGGYYLFDVPNSWNSLGGVRIYNPEDYAVSVNVEFIFYTQILNFSWLQVMILGLLVSIGGNVVIFIGFKKVHASPPIFLDVSPKYLKFPLLKRGNIENSEEVLAILPEMKQSRSKRRVDVFDLYFTNKRLIVFNLKWRPKIAFFKQAIDLWEGMNPSYRREKLDPLEASAIDDVVEKDKNSYAINYADLDWICLNKSLFQSKLNFKSKKIWKYVTINKAQYDQLSRILTRIEALKGKLEINQ